MKVFEILRNKKAVEEKPLLRHLLIEAQKEIKDYVLLNFLLKHMIDSVIEKGERFKRSYSVDGATEYWLVRFKRSYRVDGATEYWLEPTQARRPDEEMKELREDIKALKGEISNLKCELNRANEQIAKMLEVIKFNKLKEPCEQPRKSCGGKTEMLDSEHRQATAVVEHIRRIRKERLWRGLKSSWSTCEVIVLNAPTRGWHHTTYEISEIWQQNPCEHLFF